MEAPVLTLDVRFTCERCGRFVVRACRISADFQIGTDGFPDGWRVLPERYVVRCWCPDHAREETR